MGGDLDSPAPLKTAVAVRNIGRQGKRVIQTSEPKTAPPAPPRVPLGEELPIFCERCGYSLHGLPQVRCESCAILQFHCPECGHHQPINTLRPAVTKALGRIQAWWTGLSALVRFLLLFWMLVGWFAVGNESFFDYRYNGSTSSLEAVDLTTDLLTPFLIFGTLFGMVGRMFLLRWRRGWLVGIWLAGFAIVAMDLGVVARCWSHVPSLPQPFTSTFVAVALMTAATIALGGWIAFPVWRAIVWTFLPKRASSALIEWQRSLSNPAR
jgi:hypothetical protein